MAAQPCDDPLTPLLQVPEKAKHYGISSLLPSAVDPAKDLVLQFELKLTNGLSCGGAYIKFVTADKDFTPAGLKDDTPYSVMFGPDKCGDTNKVRRMAASPALPGCRQRLLLQRCGSVLERAGWLAAG